MEYALIFTMVILCAHVRNSLGRPTIMVETLNTYTSTESLTVNKGKSLSDKGNEANAKKTAASAAVPILLQGAAEDDNLQVAAVSTSFNPSSSQVLSMGDDKVISATLNNGIYNLDEDLTIEKIFPSYTEDDEMLLRVKADFTVSEIQAVNVPVTQNNDVTKSHIWQSINTIVEGSINISTKSSNGEVSPSGDDPETQDIISNTDVMIEVSRVQDEHLPVRESSSTGTAYRPHNGHFEAITETYHSDMNKSLLQSTTGGDSSLKFVDLQSVSFSSDTNSITGQVHVTSDSEQRIKNNTRLIQTKLTSSPLRPTPQNNNDDTVKSTTKTGRAMKPEAWTASQLTIGALVGILTIVMTVALFLVVLWRRRSYYHNTGNILYLQEFKTFHR